MFNNKKQTKLLAFLLAFLFAFSLCISVLPQKVGAQTDMEKLKELEESIEKNEKLLKQNKKNASALKALVSELDEKIEIIEGQVDTTKKQKTTIEKQLRKANTQLASAVKEKEKYQNILSERIEVMYMYGNTGYLELILSADGISDFINKISAIKTIVSFDNDVITKLKIAEDTVQAKKDEIQDKNDELALTLKDLNKKQDSLVASKNQREATIKELNANITTLTALIEQEESDAAELRKIIGSVGSGAYDNDFSNLKWPTPGYTYITDYYGWRIHPISGNRAFHYGVDVGASYGARIVAPGNGKVILSRYYGGYGNCIILDLGKDASGRSVTMIFGHASKLVVKKGAIVTRGQTMAYVGSTGNSTGPHLHFEYLMNGKNYNPLSYVKKGKL